MSRRNTTLRPVQHRRHNPNNLIHLKASSEFEQSVTGGLWNCQSSVSKSDFIPAYASSLSLNFLALTETWIASENTSTPSSLSAGYSFTHTSRLGKKGGGAGLLITPTWNYIPLTILDTSPSSFEFHAVSISYPVQLTIIVIYRPPDPLGDFLEELEALVCNLPDDGSPAIMLGDFNIHAQNQDSLLSLLTDFSLYHIPSEPTHKAGNHLDLVFTRGASIPNISVTPLHVSDHYFLSFTASFLSSISPVTLPQTKMISSRPKLRSLSQIDFSTAVTSALPKQEDFSLLSSDEATDVLISSISSSLDDLCPLSSRPARNKSPTPWLSDQVRETRRSLRAAERKWSKSRLQEDLAHFQTLLSTFSSNLSTAKTEFYRSRILATASNPKKLFGTFKSLLQPPQQAPDSSLLPNDFANFFDKKIHDIKSSFAPPHANLSSPRDTSHIGHATPSRPIFPNFSPLCPDAVLKLITSSRPTMCLRSSSLPPYPVNCCEAPPLLHPSNKLNSHVWLLPCLPEGSQG